MKPRGRLIVSALIAGALLAAALATFAVGSRKPSPTAGTATTEAPRVVAPPQGAFQGRPAPESASEREERPPPQAREKLIEEVLAEAGEDPGAVYAMNRVREALREGNKAFARRLFARMRGEHSESILLKAAEELIQAGE
ncbi:MAG: hypothetical protein HY721_22510 [Planctomycetes bacterium]|nr:hypothetical protein [Planctomycetota bacterium]